MGLSRFGLLALVGCNAILGIHDLSPPADSSAFACSVDTDCADHMYCETSSGTCFCVAGYTDTGGCTWTGVIADPGFQTTTAWTLGSDTMINATGGSGENVLDPGYAYGDGARAGADNETSFTTEVAQQLVMPRLSRAEPLAIELSAAALTPNSNAVVQTELGLGLAWDVYPFPFTIPNDPTMGHMPSFTVARTCLGEGQYAAETTTGSGASQTIDLVAVSEAGNVTDIENARAEFDHLEIVEPMAGECPTPGTVTNGSAEGSDAWIFKTAPAVMGDGATAGYGRGVGNHGSQGIELLGALSCDDEQATLPVSVPVPDGSAASALSIWHEHTGGQFSVIASESTLVLAADGSGVVDHYCLPATLQGTYTAVTASASSGGQCGSPFAQVAYVDDVAIATDPKCGFANGVVDGSFESGYQLSNAYGLTGNESVTVVNDGSAPDGSYYLKLATTASCGEAEWVLMVVTPLDIAAGKALDFHYEASAAGASVETGDGSSTPLAPSGWTTSKVCLVTARPGVPQGVGFFVHDTSQPCGTVETITAGIDALAVVDDPTCAN